MSETVWVALLTGAFTLASGVVGVMLTHRYSCNQAEAARREDRRRDARALLAQFVEAGTQWANANWNMVPFFQQAAEDRTFWQEWPDTDSGKAILPTVLRRCQPVHAPSGWSCFGHERLSEPACPTPA